MTCAAPDDSDFLAFMFVELSKFPCLHRNGDHHGTPPLMWPELIACIVARAKQDAVAALQARVADDGDPYEPAWLATVGFRPAYNDVTGVTLTEGVHLHHVPGAAYPFILTDGRFTWLALPPLPTRGHVRRLLRALGVAPPLDAPPDAG